ncbi:MAG TPA: glucose-6-phosphate dehydrogenase assembly protein OpcA [Chthoniobacteraceae bacterium]|nr:glucose-6-phosphate dehydrogenase assembly protein OpcA [Chthoniobacteraceae bacterium]
MTTTTATVPTLGAGLPVALGEIDRQIKKLWEASGNVATRASLMNLAVYCEGREAMPENSALIGRITASHACRAILICAEPDRPAEGVQSWISAHCHTSRAGAKQICCEQITFLLEGASRHLIPNIVFSHLDSDLPLYLWWRGEFPDPIDRSLWTWVDRLIYDSNGWRDQCAQLRLMRKSLADAKGRITLCDLNWTRSLYFRQAISSVFDHPENLAFLPSLERVAITHAPGFRFTAHLLACWLATRLGWQCRTQRAGGIDFITAKGNTVAVDFAEADGPSLSRCEIVAEGTSFLFSRESGSSFLNVTSSYRDGRHLSVLMATGEETPDALLDEELSRGGRHRVYLQTLAMAEDLF